MAMRATACHRCYNLKTRCDQKRPCIKCIKAGAECSSRVPPPPAKRRYHNRELLQQRLARCERIVEQLSDLTSGTPSTRDTSPDVSASPPQRRIGELVYGEGGVRYIDDFLIARLRSELHEMKDILGSQDFVEFNQQEDIGWLVAQGPKVLENFYPNTAHLFSLWHIFLSRVHPLTKVIHAPSLQPYVTKASGGFNSLSLGYQALIFAVLATATESLTDREAQNMLGTSRHEALHKFFRGTQIALMLHQCWKNLDMTTLQASVLCVVAMRSRHDRHALWVIIGMALRIAQRMGYHRDGTELDLSPFETEMRRRIWWQIVFLDVTSVVASGLNQLAIPGDWDTRQPQNLNDADLFPGLREAPPGREGPTEMGFCLVLYQLTKFLPRIAELGMTPALNGMGHSNSPDRADFDPRYFEKAKEAEEELRRNLVEVYTHCLSVNAGPVHKAALALQSIILDRLTSANGFASDLTKGPELQDSHDFLLRIMTMYNERYLQLYTAISNKEFLWFFESHFLHEAVTVIAGKLCLRPVGPLADHAWQVIERVYTHHSELEELHSPFAHKQARVILKAWDLREKSQQGTNGSFIEPPLFILNLRTRIEGRTTYSYLLDSLSAF